MHGFSAQSVYVCGNPSQKSPPYIGGGLLHSLVLLLYPSPINKFVNYFTVQGYWTSWSDWGACNASCDGGIRVKQRTCFNQDVGDDALLVCIDCKIY
jgi:hypothetical protein